MVHSENSGQLGSVLPRAHEWEMLSGFALALPETKTVQEKCMLEPIAIELKSYGVPESLLRQMCAEVEQTGEELKSMCPQGKLESVNVRVHMNRQVLRQRDNSKSWKYFLLKQIASSESDNLEALEHPTCFIDVYIHQE